MTARLIDGLAYAAELKAEVTADVRRLAGHGVVPCLATVYAGDDYAAAAYERRVRRLASELGCRYVSERLSADAAEADVVACVGKLGADPRVSGILVLRPLPAGVLFRDPGVRFRGWHPWRRRSFGYRPGPVLDGRIIGNDRPTSVVGARGPERENGIPKDAAPGPTSVGAYRLCV